MRKNRNSFFSESSFQSYNPNMNPPMQEASSYFYQGGPINPMNNYNTYNSNNDIESRLAKIERQLNRIDYRVTKLENNSNIITSEDFDTSNSNMYML